MSQLKTAFILSALREYNERTIAQMRAYMDRRKIKATGEGYQSIAYKAFQAGEGAFSQLSFREYLRFVDMGVGRGHPLGGLATTTLTLQASKTKGEAFIKDRVIKPKKLYSKIAYGNLGFLASKLAYGFTEEVIATLKEELEQ